MRICGKSAVHVDPQFLQGSSSQKNRLVLARHHRQTERFQHHRTPLRVQHQPRWACLLRCGLQTAVRPSMCYVTGALGKPAACGRIRPGVQHRPPGITQTRLPRRRHIDQAPCASAIHVRILGVQARDSTRCLRSPRRNRRGVEEGRCPCSRNRRRGNRRCHGTALDKRTQTWLLCNRSTADAADSVCTRPACC